MMEPETTYIEYTTKWTIVILSSLLILTVPLAILRNIPFYYVLLAFTFVVAVPFFLSVEKIICMVSFYIIAFGNPLFKGNLFPLHVNYFLIDFGLVFLFLFLLGEYSLKKHENNYAPYFSWPFLIFFSIVGLSFLIGISYANNLHYLQSEFRILCYYAVYFVAAKHFQDVKWIKTFLITVIAATLMASFDAIYTYSSLPVIRFVSRQVHMFLLVTPFLISGMILDKNKIRKIIYFVILIPIGLSVIISQTRGTWVSILVAILFAVFLSLFARLKGQRRILSFSFTLLTLVVILFLSLNFIGKMSKAKLEFVETRVESLSVLESDHSLLMRANSYLTVFEKIKQHPWFGNGLGDSATYLFFGQYSTQNNVDSTYLTILWKMGFVGLIPFLILYFLLLKKAFFIYGLTQDIFLKAFSIGILSAFVAFLILGTISPILVTSRFNFLFGVLFAITEILSRKNFLKESNEILTNTLKW